MTNKEIDLALFMVYNFVLLMFVHSVFMKVTHYNAAFSVPHAARIAV